MNAPEPAVGRCAVCHAAYTRGERFCPLDGGVVVADEASAEPDPFVGTVLDGRYAVVRLLGRGGMGTVYEAEHVGLGKRVAVKLGPVSDADRDHRMRFRREARAASQVVDAHVVQIFDVSTDATGRDFIAMEYVAGRDLDAAMRDGPMPAGRAIAIVQQVLAGLRACHGAGIVHRDIKPGNIRLADGSDRVKIMDFGIAKPLDAGSATRTGEVVGTPQFMAPEQLAGDDVDHRADLYAVGATLFALLAGAPPYADTGFTARVEAATLPAPSLAELRPGLPASLLDVVARALERSPSKRFQDAAAFADALRTCSDDAAAKADAPTRSFAPVPRGRLRSWRWLALGLAGAGALAAALAIARSGDTSDRPVAEAASGSVAPRPVAAGATLPAPAPAPAPPSTPDAAPLETAPAEPAPKRPSAPSRAQREGTRDTRPICGCRVKTPRGTISDACLRKRDAPRCTCMTPSHSRLCPFVVTVANGSTGLLPDGTRGGTMWCIDRTRRECNPLDEQMPASCMAVTRAATHREPCRGYAVGQVEGDEMQPGAYECDVCDYSASAPWFHGRDGDACKGFERTTGERLAGVLYACRAQP